ncbi:SDR family NAD(P)-dependent oxidoreductase [Rubellimicrobium rubrum]|uniref:SDR family NAD(P)-dependent oxidoreductase n=1 Tax=Rubellimicrobium rubrum TaxID=2585369 RepID=A0A5C4N3T1_9RHOB|nr:SDR family NAD(P)-dependent oxidoreductase [Rubellimicrobium rubrum]TNC51655.1 SDR family NAD(P)-dependent oxidoreductase [Rubellimicrobium rubrum]
MTDRSVQSPRTALVTGANRGLGRATAAALAAEGVKVWLGVRDRGAGEDPAREIGRGARVVTLDLDRPDTLAHLPEATGPVDILVNNAGLAHVTPMIEDPEGFGTQMRVMVHSPYELIRLYAPGMAQRGWGRIVNVSSMAGSFGAGLPGPNAYGVAKASLNALTLALSRQLPSSIKINAMCPGWMRTRMGRDDADEPDLAARYILHLATLPENGPTGGFFKDGEPQPW